MDAAAEVLEYEAHKKLAASLGLRPMPPPIWLRYNPDQPRDDHGRFGEGDGGGDSGSGGDSVSTGETRAGTGRNLTTDNATMDRIIEASNNYPQATAEVRNAPIARAIADEQGFSGPPRVVSSQEMDRLVAEGHTEMFRGIGGDHAAEQAEAYRSGEAFYTTNAAYGQGMYFTPDRGYAESYAQGSNGQVLRVALDKDAKVISYDDAHAGAKADFEARLAAHEPGSSPSGLMVTVDPGNWAMANGYDAITAHSSFGDEIVVLNRTATYAESAS